jgi:hypothetical protein
MTSPPMIVICGVSESRSDPFVLRAGKGNRINEII